MFTLESVFPHETEAETEVACGSQPHPTNTAVLPEEMFFYDELKFKFDPIVLFQNCINDVGIHVFAGDASKHSI
jgi:hypothetical protein